MFAVLVPFLAVAIVVLYLVAILIARPLAVVFYPVLWIWTNRSFKETVWLAGMTVYDNLSDKMIEFARKRFAYL